MLEKLNLSPREAAEILGVSHTQIYHHLLGRLGFPAYRIGDRWVIPRVALEEWNREQTRKASAEPE